MVEDRTVPQIGAMARSVGEGEVFEIFQQAPKDAVPHHGGNLRAPDMELAVHYAKEFYGRRQESQKLWIIPRAKLIELRLSVPDPVISQSTDAASQTTFIVFGQMQSGRPLIWLYDLASASVADAEEQAVQRAQALEGTCLRLWLCPRDAMQELTDPNFLYPPLDRSYRRLDGYDIREKLRLARQRVSGQEEM